MIFVRLPCFKDGGIKVKVVADLFRKHGMLGVQELGCYLWCQTGLKGSSLLVEIRLVKYDALAFLTMFLYSVMSSLL